MRNDNLRKEKGFFFALDSLIAIVIAFILISGVVIFINRAEEDKFPDLYLEKLSNDILFTLNKNNTLQTLDKTKIQNVLSGILPKNLGAKLNITTFSCVDNSCSSFKYNSNITVTVPVNTVENNGVIARTGFVTFKGGRIDLYAIAVLRIWLI